MEPVKRLLKIMFMEALVDDRDLAASAGARFGLTAVFTGDAKYMMPGSASEM